MTAALTTAVTGRSLHELAPIDLDELMACALLQTRVDRKYVLPLDTVHTLLSRLPHDTRVLEIDGSRSFAYRSLYFDTPDLVSYLTAARRRRRRFKVRTRVYEESGECWLEVKTRGPRGNTVKSRLPYDARDHASLAPGRDFVDATLDAHRIAECRTFAFAPVLTTRYHRSTLYLPETGSRVTIDTGLLWEDAGSGLSVTLPQLAVVETKTGSTASYVDRLLWGNRYRPCRISKFATGLAVLRPELPAAPWRRTLRRDFTPAVPQTVPATGAPVPSAAAP